MRYKYFNQSQINYLLKVCEKKGFSRKESEVFIEVIRGYPNNEIKDKFNVSLQAIKFHFSKICQKFHLSSRSQAVWILDIKDLINLEKLKGKSVLTTDKKVIFKNNNKGQRKNETLLRLPKGKKI